MTAVIFSGLIIYDQAFCNIYLFQINHHKVYLKYLNFQSKNLTTLLLCFNYI